MQSTIGISYIKTVLGNLYSIQYIDVQLCNICIWERYSLLGGSTFIQGALKGHLHE